MSKIPVGQTIGQTYAFAFGRYFTILGIIWLPMLLLAAAGYFWVLPAIGGMFGALAEAFREAAKNGHATAAPNPAIFAFYPNLWRLRLFEIAELALFVVLHVGVAREVLGTRKGPRFVYLSFGLTELRIIGSYILIFVLAGLTVLAILLAGGLMGLITVLAVHGASAKLGTAPGFLAALMGIAVLALYAAALFVFVRLTFFLVPATVAEKRFSVERSWELSRGNFWRIIIIAISASIPILIAESFIVAAWIGSIFAQIAPSLHENPGALAQKIVGAMIGSLANGLPILWAAGFLVSPILFGLTMAPSAFAYRALVPAKDQSGS